MSELPTGPRPGRTLRPAEASSVPSVLANRNFLYLWSAQALSQTAQSAVFYGLIVFIEEQTNSTIAISLMILSTIVAALLFGIVAGAIVDRVPKKLVLVSTNVLRAGAALGFVVFNQSLALLYLANFLFSAISQFFGPAETAAIPLLVRRNQLIAANGLFNLTYTLSQLAGFVVFGPPLVKAFGPEVLFIGIAALYVVCGVLVSFLPGKEPPHPQLASLNRQALLSGITDELYAGWRLIRSDTAIGLSISHLVLSMTITMVLGMLAPGFVSRVLGIDPADAVFVLSPAGIGILVGSVALPRLAHRIPKETLINVGLFVLAGAILLLGLAERGERMTLRILPLLPMPQGFAGLVSLMALVMALAFMMGLALSMVNIPSQTVLQERAPAYMRGKVFAVLYTVGHVAAIVPLLFLGALADAIGIIEVILLVAGLVLVAGVWSVNLSSRLPVAVQADDGSSHEGGVV